METRLESDSIGSMQVPADAYYGVQSLRAKENFNITGQSIRPEMIASLAKIKKAAAITNYRAGFLPKHKMEAILKACDEVAAGLFDSQFITDPVQGGAGTSTNMNINEVVANRAIEILNGKKGEYQIINPNDDVNMAQSTNDVYPTAGKLTAYQLLQGLTAQLELLAHVLAIKAEEFDGVVRMGRTQLQDAVPIRLGQSFQVYSRMVTRDIERIHETESRLTTVNMGGSAIGTSVNVSPEYLAHIAENLTEVFGFGIRLADDLIDATQNLDGLVQVSGALKTCAVDLSKMCNDLRLLSSGPKAGIAEIKLPARQNGSSIMPGKVNPVIPEVVSQVAFLVMGNDLTITMAAEGGQLELNAFEPVLFYTMFQSITAMTMAVGTLTVNCVAGIRAEKARCSDLLHQSVGVVTSLCPVIGYKKAAEIAKESLKTGVPVKKLILEKKLMDPWKLEQLLDPVSMTEPRPIPMLEKDEIA